MNIQLSSKRLLLAISLFLSGSGCQNVQPSFVNMSEDEILAYNQSKPYLQRILCVQETTTSSYIRKRKCLTYENMIYHNEKSSMTLEVMNSAPVFAFPGSIRD